MCEWLQQLWHIVTRNFAFATALTSNIAVAWRSWKTSPLRDNSRREGLARHRLRKACLARFYACQAAA